MPQERQFVTHQPNDSEAWIRLCGNTPSGGGFYSCDENGNQVEPTKDQWTTNLYVCADCGRMIDFDTREVVGRNPHPVLL